MCAAAWDILTSNTSVKATAEGFTGISCLAHCCERGIKNPLLELPCLNAEERKGAMQEGDWNSYVVFSIVF